MAKTDNPLKQLVTLGIADFAAWLLGVEIVAAEPQTIELPPATDAIRPDQVFLITLLDDRTVILHIEFQGRTSHRPMPFRVLEYMTRLTETYREIPLYNVVFYVGSGAGRHDTGVYQTQQPDGTIALAWRYQVIRLWELDADALLATGRPALLALIGQTRIQQPERILPNVIAALKAVPDLEAQRNLLLAFAALMSDKEMFAMIEKLIADDELLSDTPFMQRLRRAHEEGREEGREEGVISALRQTILDAVQVRFTPPEALTQQIERDLATLNDEATLHSLFLTALRSESVAAFQAELEEQR
jgi:predicted transposase YdaD